MLPPRRFVFLRHGQTEWNRESRIQGHTDMPLNAAGLAQAEAAAARVSGQGITRIVSSPLIRALKTAAVVAERLALPIDIDSELMERKFGSFEGQSNVDASIEPHGDCPTSPLAGEVAAKRRVRGRAARTVVRKEPPHPNPLPQGERGSGQPAHLTAVPFAIPLRPEATHAAPYLFEPKGASWSVTELGGAA